jgi:hypothetical protein
MVLDKDLKTNTNKKKHGFATNSKQNYEKKGRFKSWKKIRWIQKKYVLKKGYKVTVNE